MCLYYLARINKRAILGITYIRMCVNTSILLLKGSLENFLHSLNDYLERRSQLIRQFPPGTFLWGAKRIDSRVKRGVGVFIYVTRNQYNEGGLALYGTLLDVGELKERYWPHGEWNYLLPIAVGKIAKSIVEHPKTPSEWRLPTRHDLNEIGIKVLPGIQSLTSEQANNLLAIFSKYT